MEMTNGAVNNYVSKEEFTDFKRKLREVLLIMVRLYLFDGAVRASPVALELSRFKVALAKLGADVEQLSAMIDEEEGRQSELRRSTERATN